MEFDKSKVYTALNADESLIGAKGYFVRDIEELKRHIEDKYKTEEFKRFDDNYIYQIGTGTRFNFFYLVEPAPEKWYVVEDSATRKLKAFPESHFEVDPCREFEGTESECKEFIKTHTKIYRPFKDSEELIKTYISKLPDYERNYYEENKAAIPDIWIMHKRDKCDRYKISGLLNGYVGFRAYPERDKYWYLLSDLFDNYTFLDGSLCGVEEVWH